MTYADLDAMRSAESRLLSAADDLAARAPNAPPVPSGEVGPLIATLLAMSCESAEKLALECEVLTAALRLARADLGAADSAAALDYLRLGAG